MVSILVKKKIILMILMFTMLPLGIFIGKLNNLSAICFISYIERM